MERESASKISPLFLFFLFLSLVLMLLTNTGLTKSLRSVFEGATVPIKSGIYRVKQKVSSGLPFLDSSREENSKIERLEEELRSQAVDRVRLNVLEEENQALRRQLGAPFSPSTKFIPAKTIGLTRYLEIDKGEEDGIKPGMIVVSENILVGKVEVVSLKTSKILLPQDKDSKIPGRLLKTNASGLVIGEFGTRAFLDKVLQAETLEENDLVVTIGGGGYNRDLIIGKIGKVEKQPVQPFQRAEIIPLIDYGKLVDVFLIY